MYHKKIMKVTNKKTVLIVTPPLASPAMPSFTAAVAAGCFLGEAFKPMVYDINLDFFTDHVFLKKALEKGFKDLLFNKNEGMIFPKDLRMLEKIFQRLSSQSFSMDFFRSEAFYDPEKYLTARKKIDDLLLLLSAAFFPSRVRWGFPAESTMDDRKNSIYASVCHEKLGKMISQCLPEAVILALDSETQIPGANTIIHYIKEIFPVIKVVVLQDKKYEKNPTPAADHLFCLQHIPVFLNWIDTTWKLKHQDIQIEPDFSIFPLKEYLSPELILPLNLCFFKDTFSFQDLAAKIKDKFGAKGLLLQTSYSSFERLLKKMEFSDFFWGVQTVLEDLDTIYHDTASPTLFSSGMTLIQLKSLGEKGPSEVKNLWSLSKQGIWNHVNLTGLKDSRIKNDWLKFISLNPNIAHSYDNVIDKDPYDEPDLNGMDPSLRAYSGVRQIPGEPFWRILSDPVHLLLYLNRHGKKNLFCLRADRNHETLIALGSHITFNFMKPDELPPGFLDEICAMVEAGGSVDTTYVRYNLERAYLIGYAEENGIIVGNSSLKHPRAEFIQRVNTITGLDFNHFVERGYTSVRPEYRALGVGARLLEGLTKRAEQYKIFSIISEDNTATQKIAKKNKTKQIAVYYSEKAGKNLGIWMPEQMIEKDWKLK